MQVALLTNGLKESRVKEISAEPEKYTNEYINGPLIDAPKSRTLRSNRLFCPCTCILWNDFSPQVFP